MGSKLKLGLFINISKVPLIRDLKVEIKIYLDNLGKERSEGEIKIHLFPQQNLMANDKYDPITCSFSLSQKW